MGIGALQDDLAIPMQRDSFSSGDEGDAEETIDEPAVEDSAVTTPLLPLPRLIPPWLIVKTSFLKL